MRSHTGYSAPSTFEGSWETNGQRKGASYSDTFRSERLEAD